MNAWTDRDGAYSFDGLPAGRYRVGLMDGDAFRGDPAPCEIDVGSDRELAFTLRVHGTVLEGRILSRRDGQPVRAFRVTTIRYRFLIPSVEDERRVAADDGRFRVAVPEGGSWAVEIAAPGYAPLRTGAVSVEDGATADLGTLRLGDAGAVEGVVRDAAGRPVPFARVHVLSAKLETTDEPALTDARGAFAVDALAPGTYAVFAVSPRHPLGIRKGVVVEEGARAAVEMVLPAPAPLAIRVLDAGGRPVAGAKLVYTFEALRPLTSEMVSAYEPATFGSNVSDADGWIRKPFLPPGPLELHILTQGHAALTRTIDLQPSTPTNLEIQRD
jgi:hypothetical protein